MKLIVHLTVDAGTTYISQHCSASLQSLTPGRRVRVLAESVDGRTRARRVELFGRR